MLIQAVKATFWQPALQILLAAPMIMGQLCTTEEV